LSKGSTIDRTSRRSMADAVRLSWFAVHSGMNRLLRRLFVAGLTQIAVRCE
jgi:hypothetical protein